MLPPVTYRIKDDRPAAMLTFVSGKFLSVRRQLESKPGRLSFGRSPVLRHLRRSDIQSGNRSVKGCVPETVDPAVRSPQAIALSGLRSFHPDDRTAKDFPG